MFPVSLSEVLIMQFYDEEQFISLHWSGDQDLEDTRIWVNCQINGGLDKEPKLYWNSLELLQR